jgi:hypothetical protein
MPKETHALQAHGGTNLVMETLTGEAVHPERNVAIALG